MTTSTLVDKTILITGAASGFGRLVAQKAAAAGARLAICDINEAALAETRSSLPVAGGQHLHGVVDVTDAAAFAGFADRVVAEAGAIDVLINNAGVMPLAFFKDHKMAAAAWARCLDINIKGVLNGIMAVHDHMIARGRGHVLNVSSIYGNFPVAGAGVYGATKAAVNFLSDSLRVESQGKIKVTTVRPTGVPATNLATGVINPAAVVGILGQNAESYLGFLREYAAGQSDPAHLDPAQIGYKALDPALIADAVIYAISQPWGVSISDITVRASGDAYIL